ncbi:MAG TPA: hypothetical protein VJN88_06520 [Ktedonobacterales bacterium]|nr:hypothetical protein [Ktedonobacterales bacterium]
MSKRSGAWRLGAALALGAALGPYHFSNALTWGDTGFALALVVAPLFLALWLDRAVRRKALATLLLLASLATAFVLLFLFFAIGDQSAGLWFLVAAWLIPGTAAFAFGCVGPRISETMRLGMGCAVVAALGVLAHVIILGILQPAEPDPCAGPHPARCFQAHTSSAFATLFLVLLVMVLALGVVIAVFEGIMAVACRLWLTRLASGRTLLGAPRGTTLISRGP